MSNELSKLLKLAKGNDRSIREYAKDAGVNISTISRTIKGEITPSIKMLKKLTSESAKPRNGITFESLYAAMGTKNIQGNKEDYALAIAALTGGMMLGPAVGLATLGRAVLAKNVSKTNKNQSGEKNDCENSPFSERTNKFRKQQELFAATAMGVLYGILTRKGISFKPGTLEPQDTSGYGEEKSILVEEQMISTWIFKMFSLTEDDIEINTIAENMIVNSLLSLMLTEPNKTKKVSVVLKDKSLFERLVDIWKANSYRGNLSLILVDLDNVCIAEEVVLSTYELDDQTDTMKLV